jgi:hypothetical protein
MLSAPTSTSTRWSRNSCACLPRPQPTRKEKLTPLAKQTISKLASLGAAAALHPDVKAYLRNVVVFLRTHRLVAGGVSALATQHLELLAK